MLNHAMPPCVHTHTYIQIDFYVFVGVCTSIFIWFHSIQQQQQKLWSSWEKREGGWEKYERAYHSFWTNNNCYCCNRLSCYWFVHSPNQNAGLNVMINYHGIPSWIYTNTILYKCNSIKATSNSSGTSSNRKRSAISININLNGDPWFCVSVRLSIAKIFFSLKIRFNL